MSLYRKLALQFALKKAIKESKQVALEKESVSAKHVALWFISQSNHMLKEHGVGSKHDWGVTIGKLNSLLYLVQGYHLGFYSKPFFPDTLYYGSSLRPSVACVQRMFKEAGFSYILLSGEKPFYKDHKGYISYENMSECKVTVHSFSLGRLSFYVEPYGYKSPESVFNEEQLHVLKQVWSSFGYRETQVLANLCERHIDPDKESGSSFDIKKLESFFKSLLIKYG